MLSLQDKEVNTGRQRELDLVKGFLMIMIVFIHSFAAALLISFNIRNMITGEVAGSRELYAQNMYAALTFVNIFFISGMCYLVLAIYRKLNVKISGYVISAVIVGIVSPFTKMLVSDNQALNWILDMTFGGKGETSFCFFPYLSYVFLGYVFGKVIRRVSENEKGNFYKKSGILCGMIAAIWFVGCIVLHPGIDGFFNYMIEQYRIPGLFKVIGSFCTIMFVFAIAFWLMPMIEKWKFGYHKLCYYSKQISKMYAVHIGVYYVIGGFAAFYAFNVKECLIWAVVVLIVTDLLVQGYIRITDKIVCGR